MPPSRRHALPRRRALRLGVAALGASVAGCVGGVLDESDAADATSSGTASRDSTTASGTVSGDGTETTPSTTTSSTSADHTTHPVGVDTSLPEGSVDFPDGPKSPPERPADLTAERVREYVTTFEYRYVYNELHSDDMTEFHGESGVDSVAEYGEGFRAVAWCSAWANYRSDGETVHGDYFRQYATYYVGPDSTVRREGKPASH